MKKNEEKKISSALSQLAVKIYDDVAHPGAKNLGKAIGTLVEFITSTAIYPLEKINFERNFLLKAHLQKFGDDLSTLNEGDISSVPFEIGVPLLEKLVYVSDNDLTKLYIALLKRASIREEANLAHPAFVNCVSNLSPDEAKLLLFLKGHPLEFITPYLVKNTNRQIPQQIFSALYLSDYHNKIDSFMFPENLQIYSENLMRLGLLEPSMVYEDLHSDADRNITDRFNHVIEEHSTTINSFFKKHSTCNFDKKFKYARCEFTDFGNLFMKAIAPENKK